MSERSDITKISEKIGSTFEGLRNSKQGVNAHLSNIMGRLVDHSVGNVKSDGEIKKLMKDCPSSLHEAINHFERFSSHVGDMESHYKGVLEHEMLDLEARLMVENRMRSHMANLKRLQKKQKAALKAVAAAFAEMSKKHIGKAKK